MYEGPPKEGVVVCFDECGPLELRPIAGSSWYMKGQPLRRRATYSRFNGTEQFIGFYDVHDDCLVGQVRKRKRVLDLLPCFSRLRKCYPNQLKLHVIMDNLSSHKNKELEKLMSENNMEPVWTPTGASWLNAIEAHFGGLKKFTYSNTDDPDHQARRRRIYRYLTWRNTKAGSNRSSLHRFRYIKLG